MLVQRFTKVLEYTIKVLGIEPTTYIDLKRRNYLLFI